MIKSLYKLLPILFLIAIVGLLSSCTHHGPHRSLASKVTDYQLPLGVQKLLYAEQVLLSRELNENVIESPKLNKQEEFYRPENQNIFELKTYWIDEEDLYTFRANSVSPEIGSLIGRNLNGKNQWRLIVHPESESFYQNLIKKGERAENFLATSTSSSRTLVIWPEDRPDMAFFGKLSLNKEIGGVVRTIPATEVARSLGTTKILDSISKELPDSFSYFPETIGIAPKGQERGGMIIREIPQRIKDGDELFIPLFSLYGKCHNCPDKPLLLKMLQQSNLNPSEFVREKIISPFLEQWLELIIKEGISMEPHAQNVLIGLGPDGAPNGKFLHRDFGGFNIDLNFREKANLMTPLNLPFVNSVFKDYHQKFSEDSIKDSLHTYFLEGFIYNLDKNLSEWANAGLIDQYQTSPSKTFFKEMVYAELAKKLQADSPRQIKSENRFEKIIYRLKFGQEKPDFIERSCKKLMEFFF